jgi:hypothetical protein
MVPPVNSSIHDIHFRETTAWNELVASPDRSKHLNDAAQLLAAATFAEVSTPHVLRLASDLGLLARAEC